MTSKISIPSSGDKITISNGKLLVPNNPIIPFIEGDGIGIDVTPPMIKVVDAAVNKAYGNDKKLLGWKSMQVRKQRRCMTLKRGCRMKP